MSTEALINIFLGLIGFLVCIIGGFFWWEVRRIGKRLHDTNNVVDRHDKWITVIREKLGLTRRDE